MKSKNVINPNNIREKNVLVQVKLLRNLVEYKEMRVHSANQKAENPNMKGFSFIQLESLFVIYWIEFPYFVISYLNEIENVSYSILFNFLPIRFPKDFSI